MTQWWVSPVFFLPHIPDLELKRLATQKHEQVQIKNSPNKSLLSLVKRWQKRQPKTENIYTIILPFKINTTAGGGGVGVQRGDCAPPIPTSPQAERKPRLPPSRIITKHPTPQSGCQRRPRRDLGLSSPPDVYNPLSHTTVSAKTKYGVRTAISSSKEGPLSGVNRSQVDTYLRRAVMKQ